MILRHLREKEEYQDISDSEYLDIVKETYRLNPQFFMDFLYPTLKSMTIPPIASIKKEMIELIEKLDKDAI